MPAVQAGVEELRLRGESGQYRVFHYRKSAAGIPVLRAFQKKTPRTPTAEIELTRRRLMEMLNDYEKGGSRA
jgi:phage-related protein